MKSGARGRQAGGWTLALVALLAALALAMVAGSGHAPAQQPSAGTVTIANIPPERRAFERLLPISRKAGQRMRSIASLRLAQLGPLTPGKRLEGGAELSVSVCLKPNTNHTSSRDDCKGRLYGYDPTIAARLVVAGAKRATGGSETIGLGKDAKLRCTQKQPDRNHHCSLSVRWRNIDTDRLAGLDCAPSSCVMNLLAGAFYRKARRGEKVIVGGIENGRKVDNKGVAKVSAVLYDPGDFSKPGPKVDRQPRRRKLRIVDEGDKIEMESIYSVKVAHPQAGEKLVVDGRYAASIRGQPYNVRARSQIILTDSPRSNDPTRRRAAMVALESTRMAEENNFNCTQGSSGHKTPCPISKPAVISFAKSSGKPVYVNLIAGHGAVLDDSQKWHGGDRVKVIKKGGLKVWRYR